MYYVCITLELIQLYCSRATEFYRYLFYS